MLERDGAGLNLTEQVRDGIARHSSRAPRAADARGSIVRIIDRVAYINHDIDDALRAGVLPRRSCRASRSRCSATPARRGSTRSSTTSSSTRSAPATSCRARRPGAAMSALRDFMFERVYLGPAVRAEHARIAGVIRTLFDHYFEQPDDAAAGAGRAARSDLAQRVTDYIAGMTDRYCIRVYNELEVPRRSPR